MMSCRINICHHVVIRDTDLGVFGLCHPSVELFMWQNAVFSANSANRLFSSVWLYARAFRGRPPGLQAFTSNGALVGKDLYH